MRKRTSSRSSLFLIELILSILVLALCTTVFIRIFAASWENRKTAREWNHIQELVTNVSEIFEASDGTADVFLEYLPAGTIDKEAILYYYTSVWMPTDSENAAYEMKLYPQISDYKKSLQICITHSGEKNRILYETEISYPVFPVSEKEAPDEKTE